MEGDGTCGSFFIRDGASQGIFLLNFGTVVPAGKVFGLSETDMTGHEQGNPQHPVTSQVTSVSWQKGSHDPLVCLYGILNPGDVKARIEKVMQNTSEKKE